MSRKPYLKIDKEEFTLFYNHGFRYSHIAAHFKICRASVHKLRDKFGLPKRQTPLFDLDVDEFKRLYTEGVLIKEIARRLDVSRSFVYSARDRLGLPRRNHRKEGDTVENQH